MIAVAAIHSEATGYTRWVVTFSEPRASRMDRVYLATTYVGEEAITLELARGRRLVAKKIADRIMPQVRAAIDAAVARLLATPKADRSPA